MAAVTAYASRDALRRRIGTAGGVWTDAEDDLHDDVLDQVSRMIDGYCRRFFGTTATGTARVFTTAWTDVLIVPDLVSVSALETDTTGDGSYDTTWTTAGYHLEPVDAASRSAEAWPYTRIRVSTLTGSDNNTFPLTREAVRVTGVWGWPSIPTPIVRATILEALRALQQDATPSGVAASADIGAFIVEPELHPTTRRLIGPYRRVGGLGSWDGR